MQAHPDWKGKSSFGEYGDVVEELDHGIGEILATLKTEKLDKNTIVVFLSDNGPEPRQKAQAKPFRGPEVGRPGRRHTGALYRALAGRDPRRTGE